MRFLRAWQAWHEDRYRRRMAGEEFIRWEWWAVGLAFSLGVWWLILT